MTKTPAIEAFDFCRCWMAEKFHRHVQHFPHVSGVPDRGELCLDLPLGMRLDERHDKFQNGDRRQQPEERIEPVRVLSRKEVIEKHARKYGTDDPQKRSQQGGDGDERNGDACARQTLLGKREHALRFSARDEVFRGFEHQADARETVVERLHRDGVIPSRGIVEDRFLPLETAQNDEVVKIPMHDAGEHPPLFELLGFELVSFCGQAVVAGGFQNVPRVGAVAGNAAVGAHLFERDPFAVVGKDHRERRGAAFERLHLHDDGDLCGSFPYRFVLLLLRHIRPQLKR